MESLFFSYSPHYEYALEEIAVSTSRMLPKSVAANLVNKTVTKQVTSLSLLYTVVK